MTSTSRKPSPPADGRILVILAILGALAGLWALFLWRELIRARSSGATPFCGFGGGDCGALWDGAFAGWLHATSGLPVAAWGVVWGAAAWLLAMAATAGATQRWHGALRAAVSLTALAGLAGVALMLAASAAAGMFCTSCALTYLLTGAYAVVALVWLRRDGEPPLAVTAPGAAVAAAAVAVFYLLLLVPGQRTPKAQAGHEALAEAVAGTEKDNPGSEDPRPTDTPAVEAFVASLSPQLQQGLANSLHIYKDSAALASEEPRTLAFGSPQAPVRITDFTDVKCSHCATLHQTMAYLASISPAGSFSLEERQFPLDGNCNPHLTIRGPETVRCLAARALICMEGTPRAFEFSGALFENQQALDNELVYRLAQPFMERAALESCVASADTAARLRDDVDYAWAYRPPGTPLVLVNGREGTAFGPFLYAMILTGGAADHPAFAALPPPRIEPHDHEH